MKKVMIVFLLSVLSSLFNESEAQVIQGSVVNAEQEPLIGVIVKLNK